VAFAFRSWPIMSASPSEGVPDTLDFTNADVAFRRSSLLPIFKLLPEIIVRIMTQAQLTTLPLRRQMHPGLQIYEIDYEWEVFLKICKGFRAIALSTLEMCVFINTDCETL
jgi:hypothetical protein